MAGRCREASFDWPTLVANKDREIDRLEASTQRCSTDAGVDADRWPRAICRRPHRRDRRGQDGHRRQDPDRHRRPPGACRSFPGMNTASSPTRPSTCESCPSASSSSAAAISPSSSPASSTASASRSRCSIAASRSCAASTTICAMAGERAGPARGSMSRCRAIVARIEPAVTGWRLHFGDGASLEVDKVMAATGRRPNTGELDAGRGRGRARPSRRRRGRRLFADEPGESSTRSATVTNRLNLTPVAIREGAWPSPIRSSATGRRAMDHDGVASAVFSQPPVGTVGLTEAEARRRHAERRHLQGGLPAA